MIRIVVVDDHAVVRYGLRLLLEAESDLEVELFYETKANLKKEQVRALRDAGVTQIQPGIESFSDSVLTLMRKGVTGLQNIQLLKWCTELVVRPYWNVLWGFPGEPAADYERMANIVPLLTHLAPPIGFGGLRLDRFSPNFFDAASLGFAATLVAVGLIAAKVGEKILEWLSSIWVVRVQIATTLLILGMGVVLTVKAAGQLAAVIRNVGWSTASGSALKCDATARPATSR